MKKALVALALLILSGIAGTQMFSMYQKNGELTRILDRHLDEVGEAPDTALKKVLVDQAAQKGIQLAPNKIRLTLENTKDLTYTQRKLQGRVAQYTDQRVGIRVQYAWQILGMAIPQEAQAEKLKTIQSQRMAPTPDP